MGCTEVCVAVRLGMSSKTEDVLTCETEFAGGAVGAANEDSCDGATIAAALVPALLVDRLPKASLKVRCVVFHADGGELAAAVVGASAALAAAGVPCVDLGATKNGCFDRPSPYGFSDHAWREKHSACETLKRDEHPSNI